MLTLIRDAELYTPEALGRRDILIARERIVEIAERIELSGSPVDVIDAGGRTVWPGFVDALTHPAGGGGEGGYGNRTREIDAESFIAAGITTPIGALGTDAVTRSLDVLFGKVMELRAKGLAAFMYSGSYRLPAVTLTGDVVRDLVLIEPVIGVGEVAIADHRGSQPSAAELRRLAADTRLGGTISGKGGTVMLHLGDGPGRLQVMRAALENSDLAAHSFYPTHCNRSQALLEESFRHAVAGGWIDLTASTIPEFIEAGEVSVLETLSQALEQGVPLDRLTVSSDAGGSLPHYEGDQLLGSKAASPGVLLELALQTFNDCQSLFSALLPALTANPAAALGLTDRGALVAGGFADLLLLDTSGRSLAGVMANGRWLQTPDSF
ncbi:beta-aspartyl-peptidase [Halioglobus japonicus]|nr:beta-aspartyl-peptidase [Halioglobus japonicus]AQA18898.1 beta-aspartyl-peptidase [Halioglobus japonicus]GHD20769.1 isoaspartyl dipeptidase [Halioglobus japonicus]